VLTGQTVGADARTPAKPAGCFEKCSIIGEGSASFISLMSRASQIDLFDYSRKLKN